MTPETLLLRQIHPSFIQNGRVTSQAFRPTPKDELLLSVDDGDRTTAEAAWQRFITNPDCKSAGVQAVTHAECASLALAVIEDGNPHPEHCSIDFREMSAGDVKRKGALLRAQAEARGWLFREAVT